MRLDVPWIVSLPVSHRDHFETTIGNCRVSLADERQLIHLGHELDLQPYREAAAEIVGRAGQNLRVGPRLCHKEKPLDPKAEGLTSFVGYELKS